MISSPLLSVIIPAYNMQNYLKNCILSIEHQENIISEIIVVNDGSADNTADVVKKLQKNYCNIKLINQENAGLFHARINGALEAKGKYITFVDADDTILPNFYPLVLSKIIEESADILEFGIRKFNSKKLLFEFSPPYAVYDMDEAIRRQFEKDNTFCSNCNKIYKNVLFQKVNFSDNIRCYEEDKLINIKVMSVSKKMISVPYIGYLYNTRNESITTKKITKDYLNIVENSRIVYQYLKKEKPSLSCFAARDLCAHLAYCYINLSLMDMKDSERYKYKLEYKREFNHLYQIEALKKYKSKTESIKRKLMIYLFHISPILAEKLFCIINSIRPLINDF